MTSYERMCRLIKSTGLYRLDGTTRVEAELFCYGRHFDLIEKRLDNLMRDRFLSTASPDFLKKYQMLFGMACNLPEKKLREALVLRGKVNDNDFTEEGVLKCLKAGGITAKLTKTANSNSVTVSVLSDSGIFGTAAESDRYILSCMPCGVNATISR